MTGVTWFTTRKHILIKPYAWAEIMVHFDHYLFLLGGDYMNNSYQFDHFNPELMKSEITRLTENVGSHSQALAKLLLENGLYKARNVLDVGCGTGAMIQLFSTLLPEANFYGIDNSEVILETAVSTETDRVHFVHGQASALPFPDNTFDFVYTRLVLMHNRVPNEIVKEMIRVCKPNGVVCAVETDDGTQIYYPYAEELGKLIKANTEYIRRTNGPDRTIGRKLFSMFSSEGLHNIKVITQTSDYTCTSPTEIKPFLINQALSNINHLVEEGLLLEEERLNFVNEIIPAFLQHPARFDSGSFMYAFGQKK